MKIKILKYVVTIICLILFYNMSYAEDWSAVPVKNEYYKDKFKKPYWHFGLNINYGSAYYLNIKDNNTFSKYILALQLNPEKDFYHLAPLLRISTLLESEYFTDEMTSYSSRFKVSSLGLGGVNIKFPSPISIFQSIKPYFLLGGGFTQELTYRQFFIDQYRNLYNNKLSGSGPVLGFSFGSELELITNLFFLDLGMNYLYNFNIKQFMNDESFTDQTTEEEELDFYFGFTVNLF